MAMLPKIKQAKEMIATMQNPQLALNKIMQSNPQIGQIIGQYGSVDGAINAICKQKGIDFNEFMKAINE